MGLPGPGQAQTRRESESAAPPEDNEPFVRQDPPSQVEGSTSSSSPKAQQLAMDWEPQQQLTEDTAKCTSNTPGFSVVIPPFALICEHEEKAEEASGDGSVLGVASPVSASSKGGHPDTQLVLASHGATDEVASGALPLPHPETMTIDASDAQVSHQEEEATTGHSTPSLQFALTSLGHLEPFVDAYFSLFHQSFPIVHEATFRAQFMEVVPRPAGNTWQVLVFVLAAVGALTASTEPSDVDLALFEAGKTSFSMGMVENSDLLLVQALALTSNYMQKRDKPSAAYSYMGLARRVAIGISLHSESPNWGTNLFTAEMRRRIWFCLDAFDTEAAITFSRPLDFPNEGVCVQLPMNVFDSVCIT